MKKIILIFLSLIIYNFTLNIYDCSAQWIEMSDGMPVEQIVYDFASNGSNIFAGTVYGVYNSTNNGENWIQAGLSNEIIWSLESVGTSIFAGAYRVFVTTNNGSNWNVLNNGLPLAEIFELVSSNGNLFAGTFGHGVYLSTNTGQIWISRGLGDKAIVSLFINGTRIFAGTGFVNGDVFYSTDSGINWIESGLTNNVITSFCFSNNNLFAGGYSSGIFLSTDNGETWKSSGLPGQFVNCLVSSGSDIIAGTQFNGVFLSTNDGETWIDKNQGFTDIPAINTLFIKNDFIFAGTFQNGGVWRRNLSEITGLKTTTETIPADFTLQQNYPNPFNPKTIISYTLPKTQHTKLRVYNELAQLVAILVNEKQYAGSYSIEWNAKDFPSGVYFYKLETEIFSETKRMLLIK